MTSLEEAKSDADSNSDIKIDFDVPEPESLKALPQTDPEIVAKIEEIETIAENQISSKTFEIYVAEPITFEVSRSAIDKFPGADLQQKLERWAEKKLEQLLKNLTLRSRLN